ncbi:MAG: hypothetical protein IM618_11395 [Cytophagales bacterium]|nr:hypothetical protein [Cytophagales bacterium]
MRNTTASISPFSPLCTQSQAKAMSGKNNAIALAANRGYVFPSSWSLNDRINYKSLLANPQYIYVDEDVRHERHSDIIAK